MESIKGKYSSDKGMKAGKVFDWQGESIRLARGKARWKVFDWQGGKYSGKGENMRLARGKVFDWQGE